MQMHCTNYKYECVGCGGCGGCGGGKHTSADDNDCNVASDQPSGLYRPSIDQ